jgi:hypothetical protein
MPDVGVSAPTRPPEPTLNKIQKPKFSKKTTTRIQE